MVSNFEAASKFLIKIERDKLTLMQKMNLFFVDYDLIPLLIQQSYLNSIIQINKTGNASI